MIIKVVLNGGLRSCCSNYPLELVRDIIKDWIRPEDDLEVLDRQRDAWQPDELTALAEKYFGDAIYPLLYVGDNLTTVGDLPDKDTLLKMLADPAKYAISPEDILEEARQRGLLDKSSGE